jgi:hypothetical protein
MLQQSQDVSSRDTLQLSQAEFPNQDPIRRLRSYRLCRQSRSSRFRNRFESHRGVFQSPESERLPERLTMEVPLAMFRSGFQQPGEVPQFSAPRVRQGCLCGLHPFWIEAPASLPPVWTAATECSSASRMVSNTVRQSPLACLPAS